MSSVIGHWNGTTIIVWNSPWWTRLTWACCSGIHVNRAPQPVSSLVGQGSLRNSLCLSRQWAISMKCSTNPRSHNDPCWSMGTRQRNRWLPSSFTVYSSFSNSGSFARRKWPGKTGHIKGWLKILNTGIICARTYVQCIGAAHCRNFWWL